MMARTALDALIAAHTPLLVLFPEIPSGLKREDDRNPDFPEAPPLGHDYHPRDVRLVLNHATLRGRSLRYPLGWPERRNWSRLLEDMEAADYEPHLTVLREIHRTDRDAFWQAYAAIDKDLPEHGRRCYARLVPGKGVNRDRILVQYWYAYFYNDFWNTHEMDWEVVMLVFTAEAMPRPVVTVASAHHHGSWLPWSEVGRANDRGEPDPAGTHPVIYVAHGSHANYFYGGALYPTTPAPVQAMSSLLNPRVPIDFVPTFHEGDRHIVPAALVPEPTEGRWSVLPDGEDWRWLNHRGRWGAPGKGWDLEFGDDGPYGPPIQRERWETPFRWINTRCGRARDIRLPTRLDPALDGHAYPAPSTATRLEVP